MQAKPFIKWIGCKRSLLPEILKRVPEKFNRYWEPFIGGGALFYELWNQGRFCNLEKNAIISDINGTLINAYEVVRNHPDQIIDKLKWYQENHSEEFYYAQRADEPADSISKAAWFIYLNKTGFNGMWRVSSKTGKNNVPFGKAKNPTIYTEEGIRKSSEALKSAKIFNGGFEEIEPVKGDFVYFDPPYFPITERSYKVYNGNKFEIEQQTMLRDFSKTLAIHGTHVMISNLNCEFIRDLYSDPIFNVQIILAPRYINSKGDGRKSVEEVLITTNTR